MEVSDQAGIAGKAGSTPISLTVVILACNEAHHIRRAIDSLDGLASRVILVDSGSSDETRQIARSVGAEVHRRDWVNYADQFQWALDNCGIDTAWTMRLDADEWLGPDLVAEIAQTLPSLGREIGGISLNRRHYFLGRWIRYGGRYPLHLLRIWRTGQAHIEQRWMDEHMVLDRGTIAQFDGMFVDENTGDLGYFTAKHNRYATREAIDAIVMKHARGTEARLTRSTEQASRKRRFKINLYNRLPLGVGPLAYFVFRYIFQLGFLDGKAGLVYHFLQGFWYRFLVDAKRMELERAIAGATTDAARIEALEHASGLPLQAFQKAADG